MDNLHNGANYVSMLPGCAWVGDVLIPSPLSTGRRADSDARLFLSDSCEQ